MYFGVHCSRFVIAFFVSAFLITIVGSPRFVSLRVQGGGQEKLISLRLGSIELLRAQACDRLGLEPETVRGITCARRLGKCPILIAVAFS